jgi:SET domain-containing protein
MCLTNDEVKTIFRKYAKYVYTNNVVRLSNHCCNANTTMYISVLLSYTSLSAI